MGAPGAEAVGAAVADVDAVGTTVEERPFRAASTRKQSRALAPEDPATATTEDLDVFRALVNAGRRLAEIHVHYEDPAEYPLVRTEKPGKQLDWRVTKMRLSKDRTTLVYNDFLTLSGIPKETYEYRLGNRSALEWVLIKWVGVLRLWLSFANAKLNPRSA